MSTSSVAPIVGIICNFSEDENGHQSHRAGARYVEAVREAAGAVPVLLPTQGSASDVAALLDRLDGVVLTGGASNIEPHHYDAACEQFGAVDKGRDDMALALVRACIEREVPLFGVCRGHQEINVALGGTLHPVLHEAPGHMDHRRRREKPVAEQLKARHWLDLTPGGLLAGLIGETRTLVNSLHAQGVDKLGERLAVEGVAEDGTIEAIRVLDTRRFAVGVQWHAEIDAIEHPLHAALFGRFGADARDHASSRSQGHGRPRRVA
ncbi:MAG: gamma-glutamyl-gamma-aminobutyrate hydrolase family protein [Alphaproteobacteria bacterium]